MNNTNPEKLLSSIGLKEKVIKSTLKNSKLTNKFTNILTRNNISEAPTETGNNLYYLVTKAVDWVKEDQIDKCVQSIVNNDLSSRMRVDLAIEYFKVNVEGDGIKDKKEFDDFCGVGVNVSQKEIEEYVDKFIDENLEEMKNTKPTHSNIMAKLRNGIKFVEPKDLVTCFNNKIKSEEFKKKFGEQNKNEDKKKNKKEKKEEKPKEKTEKEIAEEEKKAVKKYRLEKLLAKNLAEALNKPHIIKAHKERTGGKVITRFPPEPNGYLHIGHCKAIRFNFKIALDHDGYTYLRFDDTNPAKEKQEFIDQIIEGVKWLGYTPYKITHASDYFDKLYEMAVELIKREKAFVCFLSKEEAKNYRENKQPSPHRDASIEENLKQFQLMKNGFYSEGECVLRAKIDYESPHTTLNDPPIYRIKHVSHPHAGDKWCIYPLYDFTHSLCDNFEDITHSLCTLEFATRRELYYWSLNELDIFKPYVWEYSRLNITNTVLSKRKIMALVEGNRVWGWDDPRLLTLNGMRRRGYPPEALNYFCDLISVTRRGNDKSLSMDFFEFVMREYLTDICKKSFVVLDPVELTLTNFNEWSKDNSNIFKDSDFLHELRLKSKILVDRDDTRETEEKKFWGISPNKTVRLKYGPFVKITKINSSNGRVESVEGEIKNLEEVGNYKKIKGILHWVSSEESMPVKVNIFEKLFNASFPGKDNHLFEDLNPNSFKRMENAVIDKQLLPLLKMDTRLQFERLGFFGLDTDSDLSNDRLVFNRIVAFKSGKKKNIGI